MSKRSYKRTNEVLEDHYKWLVIDISTAKHPYATMAIDKAVWDNYEGGRIRAWKSKTTSYITAVHWYGGSVRYFHHIVLPKRQHYDVDHVSHGSMNFIDNRLSNLRSATRSQNLMNTNLCSNNTSGVTGVYLVKRDGKWNAKIQVSGKMKDLGRFENKQDAIDARSNAENKYYAEYAFNNNNGDNK